MGGGELQAAAKTTARSERRGDGKATEAETEVDGGSRDELLGLQRRARLQSHLQSQPGVARLIEDAPSRALALSWCGGTMVASITNTKKAFSQVLALAEGHKWQTEISDKLKPRFELEDWSGAHLGLHERAPTNT